MASLKEAGTDAKPGKGGGKKLAGLPVYVWVGVIAGGLLLGLYLRSRGSSSSAASGPAVDTSSTPASIDGLTTGLSGSSVGGDTTASVDNGMSDLLNALAVQSQDTESLVAQEAGLTNAIAGWPVANLGSSGGSGAGSGKPKAKPHHKPATKAQHKQAKKHQQRNRKGAKA